MRWNNRVSVAGENCESQGSTPWSTRRLNWCRLLVVARLLTTGRRVLRIYCVETDSHLSSPDRSPPVLLPTCMNQPTETILTTIPAAVETERLLVVLVCTNEVSRMELRQQSFSKGLGWFTQSTVQLEPGQVAALRNSLGSSAGRPAPRLPREYSTIAPSAWQPRVVHADSA